MRNFLLLLFYSLVIALMFFLLLRPIESSGIDLGPSPAVRVIANKFPSRTAKHRGLPESSPAIPAVVMIYDPSLGGINCDNDCSTIATGPLEDWHYGSIAACDPSLLGAYVTLPGVGVVRCMDTGSAVRVAYSEYWGEYVLYFDVMWKLEEWGRPEWAGMRVTDWSYQWSL